MEYITDFNEMPTKTKIALEAFIINMVEKFKLESNSYQLQVPLEGVESKISYYTGIPIPILQWIQKRDNANKFIVKSVNLNTHITILKSLLQLYISKQFPTPQLLYDKLLIGNTIITLTFEQFERELFLLGLDYRTLNGKTIFMEDPNLTFERYFYINKIKKIRKRLNRIYYISIRQIDSDFSFKKPGLEKDILQNKLVYNGCVLMHAVSKSHVAHAMYCENATEEDFNKWVVDILFRNFESGSKIILDNSPLTEKLSSKSVSIYNTKKDLLKWLHKHNIPCSDILNRAELYELARKNVIFQDMIQIDQMIRAEGHEILRLPLNFDDLTPLDSIWKNIQEECIRNPPKSEEMKDRILSLLEKKIKLFPKFEKEIEITENVLFEHDKNMEHHLEKYVMDSSIKSFTLEEILRGETLDNSQADLSVNPVASTSKEAIENTICVIESVSSIGS